MGDSIPEQTQPDNVTLEAQGGAVPESSEGQPPVDAGIQQPEAAPAPVTSEEVGGEQPKGELLAGRFKNVEELVKGYHEAESLMSSRDEKTELGKTLQGYLEQTGLTPEEAFNRITRGVQSEQQEQPTGLLTSAEEQELFGKQWNEGNVDAALQPHFMKFLQTQQAQSELAKPAIQTFKAGQDKAAAQAEAAEAKTAFPELNNPDSQFSKNVVAFQDSIKWNLPISKAAELVTLQMQSQDVTAQQQDIIAQNTASQQRAAGLNAPAGPATTPVITYDPSNWQSIVKASLEEEAQRQKS